MSIGLVFWILMLIWGLFGGAVFSGTITGDRVWQGNSLFAFILFFLLGWAQFGFIIHK